MFVELTPENTRVLRYWLNGSERVTSPIVQETAHPTNRALSCIETQNTVYIVPHGLTWKLAAVG
jgi:hypothetical protein